MNGARMGPAVGVLLIAFAIIKSWFALTAMRRRRAFLAGAPGAVDPAAGMARPWLFMAYCGWRFLAAAVAASFGIWLIVR
jgi:hypothetical protein